MRQPSETRLKYGLLAIIWIGVFIVSVIMALTGSIAGDSIGALMGGGAFLAAGLATGAMFEWGQTPRQVEKPAETVKQKNDQGNLDPMSLLTDEDIEELRRDVKESMRRRLMQNEDGELNGIDALLADQDRRQRR